MEKLFGVGLLNLFAISIFVMVFFVVTKTIFVKYPVPGVTELVTAA